MGKDTSGRKLITPANHQRPVTGALYYFIRKEGPAMAVFRVEKTRDFTVMSNHHLRNKALSLKAKGLQCLMLSLPESWDFTTKGLSFICKDGVDSITSALNELEKHGYLTRRRLRDGRGRLADIEYTIHEQPVEPENGDAEPIPPKRENPRLDKPRLDNPVLGEPEQVSPILENPAQLNIYNNQIIQESNTDPSIRPLLPSDGPIDRMDAYREIIMDNIGYVYLCGQYGQERINEIVEVLLDAVCTTKPSLRVDGEDKPAEVVKSRLLKLDHSHIEYCIERLDSNTTKIRNIKAYLLTTLYNTPATIDHYYRAEVQHDLYGGMNGGP
jgi:hypothetical protein